MPRQRRFTFPEMSDGWKNHTDIISKIQRVKTKTYTEYETSDEEETLAEAKKVKRRILHKTASEMNKARDIKNQEGTNSLYGIQSKWNLRQKLD